MHASRGSFFPATVPCVPAARIPRPPHLPRVSVGKVTRNRPTRLACTRAAEVFAVTRTHSRGKKWAPVTTSGVIDEIGTVGGGGAAGAAVTTTAARTDPAASATRLTIRK